MEHFNTGTKNGMYRETAPKECEHCGSSMVREIGNGRCIAEFERRRFCSHECRSLGRKYLSGKDHPNWKEDSLPKQRDFRHDKWAKQVKEKYDFTCGVCDKRGGDLHSHHVFAFVDYPDYRYEVSNGRCLCIPCHRDIHSFATEL